MARIAEEEASQAAKSEGGANGTPGEPKHLGGFELLGRLGKGGMGTVVKARQVSMNRLVALKILPKKLAQDEAFVKRFVREARSAAALHHTNIVQAYDVGLTEGYYYFAMEYVEGEGLDAVLLREGPLEPSRALALMKQATSALAHAHEKGIVHRDIKPSNLMVDSKGDVRVTDFGLAKHVEGDIAVTADGVVLGTPAYVSPEMASGKGAEPRSDLYSLGSTFFHLLAGRPPFEGQTFSEILIKQVTEAPPPLARLAPRLDRRFAHVIDRLLRKKPEDRYRSAQALLDALNGLGELQSPTGETTHTLSDTDRLKHEAAVAARQRRQTRRRLLAVLGAVAACGLLARVVGPSLRGSRPQSRKEPTAAAKPESKTASPTPAPVPQPDAAGSLARGLFRTALEADAAGQPQRALRQLNLLEKELASTQFVAANRAAIAELRAKAEAKFPPPVPPPKEAPTPEPPAPTPEAVPQPPAPTPEPKPPAEETVAQPRVEVAATKALHDLLSKLKPIWAKRSYEEALGLARATRAQAPDTHLMLGLFLFLDAAPDLDAAHKEFAAAKGAGADAADVLALVDAAVTPAFEKALAAAKEKLDARDAAAAKRALKAAQDLKPESPQPRQLLDDAFTKLLEQALGAAKAADFAKVADLLKAADELKPKDADVRALGEWLKTAAKPVFADNFEGGKLNTDRWQIESGAWQVERGQLVGGRLGTDERIFIKGARIDDFILEYDVLNGPKQVGYRVGAIFRYNPKRYIYALFYDGLQIPSKGHLMHGGNADTGDSNLSPPARGVEARPGGHPSYPIETGKTYHYRIRCVETKFEVDMDGKRVCDGTDSLPAPGKVGFFARSADAHFDNVRLYRIVPLPKLSFTRDEASDAKKPESPAAPRRKE